ncbi:MAG TPA: hypothetical protein VFD87_04190 [Phototrophicaceae bacterium]|jgi:hypothetical protein|nr:hypothetical protein [Phototrophicaceae bacterium]
MSHYKFAAALIAGLALALPPILSTAVAQQQSSAAADATKTKKEPTAGQTAARERQKKCAVEWKEAKASGKIETGATWPKFWSACNKRLKAAAN